MRPVRHVRTALAVAVAAALPLGGCGGDRENEWAGAPPARGADVPCSRSTAPARFEPPESLPLPPDAVVIGVGRRGDFVRYDVRVPRGLDGTLGFFLDRLEPAGYEIEEGEREGTAAELEFEGHEQRGRLRVYHDRCPGRTHADIVLAPE